MEMGVENETPIDTLPSEILIKIFEQMDSTTLKSAALVCKRWNETIGQSIIIMKQLPITIEGGWRRLMKKLKNFTRKNHTIKIDSALDWPENFLKVLRQQGLETRQLELIDCLFEIEKVKVLNKVFPIFKKLEVLKIISTDMDVYRDRDPKKIKPVNLPHLKTVLCSESGLEILHFIRSSQPTSLKINNWNSDPINAMECLSSYLVDQKKLEQLALRHSDLDISGFGSEKIGEMQFPLKKLSLLEHSEMVMNEENLLAFFDNFVDTLEYLELGQTFPDSVYEMIFKKFRHLKTLKVNIGYAPSESSFYHNLRPNPSVKELVICGFNNDAVKSLEGFIGNLPNIETLIMETNEIPNEIMVFITNNLLKVKSLHLKIIDGKLVKSVQMPSVKSLHIRMLPELQFGNWKKIVKAFPNIEFLRIEAIFDPTSLSSQKFNIITKAWKNLKHIHLGYGFLAEKQFFNQMLKKCEFIQSVEVHESAFVPQSDKGRILKDFKKPGLRLVVNSTHPSYSATRRSLWENEGIIFDCDLSDNDSDTDEDSDLGFMILNDMMHALGGAFSDDDNNEFIYFDSDGEMRHWDEDPADYGFDVDYLY